MLRVKSDKSDWLRVRNEFSAHFQKIGPSQRKARGADQMERGLCGARIRMGCIGLLVYGPITSRLLHVHLGPIYMGCLPFVRINRLGRALNNGKVFPNSANQPNEIALTICNSISRNCFRLMRDWKLET